MASRSDGDITQAAERVWGILDHLAANNPEEYDKFVKQQLDHGKEALAVPEPRMCLRCSLNRSRQKYRYLFVNVCAWPRVPKPKTDQDSIPAKGGVLRHVLLGQNRLKTEDLVYDLAFHPSVLEECLRDSQLIEMLVGLCLDYVENEVDVCLDDRKSCKRVGIKHKGPLEDIRSSIDEEWRHCLPAEVRMDLEPQVIISKIKEMKTKKEDAAENLAKLRFISERSTCDSSGQEISSGTNIGLGERNSREQDKERLQLPMVQPLKPQGRALIEELQSSTSTSCAEPEGNRSLCTPEHSIAVFRGEVPVENDGRPGRTGDVLRVVVKLPGVDGVKDVELEVSESDLELSVPEKYHLLMEFPHQVDDEQIRAKFDTKLSELIITIPCQN